MWLTWLVIIIFNASKNAKDMAAGAVLVVSTYTVITGLIIFVPKIIALIFGNR